MVCWIDQHWQLTLEAHYINKPPMYNAIALCHV